MARIAPFDFRDLRAVPPAKEPVPTAQAATETPPTPADVAAAFADGRREGEAAANCSAEAAAALRLAAIADELAAQNGRFGAALDAEKHAMRAAARTLFETVLRGVWRRTELGGALDLVDRLIAAGPERPETVLRLHPDTQERVGEALAKALGERKASFVRIESDTGIADGDFRLEWRGGAAARSLAGAAAEIDRALDSAAIVEASEERS